MQLYHVLKPPAGRAAARRTVPSRVRMEIAATPGGAIGRGNMPPPVTLDDRAGINKNRPDMSDQPSLDFTTAGDDPTTP